MPPLPAPDPPLIGGNYYAVFATANGAFGFDVRRNGYSSTVEANRRIIAIPWAQGYSVVVQRGGLNPHVRRYRALVYTESDFIGLALQVNVAGTLQTPREGPVLANLDSMSRGDTLDPTIPTGATAVDLVFTPLQ